jgi:hypothetical protein
VPQFSLSAKVAASFSLPKRKSTYGNASIRVFLKGGTYTHITARSTQHAWRHARHVSKRLPLELYVSVARAQVNSTSTVYMDVADQQGQRAPHGTLPLCPEYCYLQYVCTANHTLHVAPCRWGLSQASMYTNCLCTSCCTSPLPFSASFLAAPCCTNHTVLTHALVPNFGMSQHWMVDGLAGRTACVNTPA